VSGVAPVFRKATDIAKEVETRTGQSLASAKAAVSRLLRSGAFPQSLQIVIIEAYRDRLYEAKVSAERVAFLEREMTEAFNAVGSARARSRLSAPRSPALAEAYVAASVNHSLMLVLPFVPLSAETEQTSGLREQLALRADLNNSYARDVFRVWLFTSVADCYQWYFALIWESVNPGLSTSREVPTKKEIGKARERVKAVLDLEKRGLLKTKLIRPTAAVAHAMILNFRGEGERKVYEWRFDEAGHAQDFHAVGGGYLPIWYKFADEIERDDNCVVVQRSWSIGEYTNDLLNKRRSPSKI